MEWYEVPGRPHRRPRRPHDAGAPVVFAFFAVNIAGAFVFMGGAIGLEQLVRNAVDAAQSFALLPIPLFILMGEIMFHTGVAGQANRRGGPAHRPRAGTPLPGRGRGRDDLLVALRLHHRQHRDAREHPSPGDVPAGLPARRSRSGPSSRSAGSPCSSRRRPLRCCSGASPRSRSPGSSSGRWSRPSSSSSLFVVYIVVRCRLNPELAPPYDVGDLGWRERIVPFLKYVLPLMSIFVVVVGSILGGLRDPDGVRRPRRHGVARRRRPLPPPHVGEPLGASSRCARPSASRS